MNNPKTHQGQFARLTKKIKQALKNVNKAAFRNSSLKEYVYWITVYRQWTKKKNNLLKVLPI